MQPSARRQLQRIVALPDGCRVACHGWNSLPHDHASFKFRHPGFESIRVTRSVSGPDQTHMRSPSMRLHQYPACGGRGLGADETNLHSGLSTYQAMWVRGSSTRIRQTVRVWKIRECCSSESVQALFITAPSMATPNLMYFHSATSSFRAMATMFGFFLPPPSTRCLNQRESADCGW